MKEIRKEIFRAYDIRGVVDHDFDPEFVEILGQACGAYFLSKGITQAVVGRDCRHSSAEYQARLTRGLASTGVDVVLIGMVPTPVFYFAVKKLDRQAGVMITASHNPPEYNGFKVWAGETTIHTTEISRIHDLMLKGEFPAEKGMVCEHDIVPSYLDDLVAQVKLERPVKVVLDGGNGSGGLVCAELLRRAGAEVVPLYCEPDGSFPNHHPDPVVEKYMGDLKTRVLAENADLGVGLDGDADRIGVIDEQGRMMYGDQILAICARDMLKTNPGATVIAEVKSSHLLFKDIEAHGGRPLMWITGHSVMKAKMIEVNALLAGEMSGHMFFADRYYGFDDGPYAALRLIETLSRSNTPLSAQLNDWPTTFNTPEIRMDCPEKIKFKLVDKALDTFKGKFDLVDVDGVRLIFDDGWGLIRASNTQPALVLRFEAQSPERLNQIRSIIEEPLSRWIKEMS